MNDAFKKFHLNLAKENNAMNEVFKNNWGDINEAFLKHNRQIMSVEREVKSIPTMITRNVEKEVAYTDAKYRETILVSK